MKRCMHCQTDKLGRYHLFCKDCRAKMNKLMHEINDKYVCKWCYGTGRLPGDTGDVECDCVKDRLNMEAKYDIRWN